MLFGNGMEAMQNRVHEYPANQDQTLSASLSKDYASYRCERQRGFGSQGMACLSMLLSFIAISDNLQQSAVNPFHVFHCLQYGAVYNIASALALLTNTSYVIRFLQYHSTLSVQSASLLFCAITLVYSKSFRAESRRLEKPALLTSSCPSL